MKILSLREMIALEQVDHLRSEKKLLARVSHPMVTSLTWWTRDSHHLYLLCPYVPGGELFSYLRCYTRFPMDTATFYLAEVTAALSYLHSLDIIYRDLKPENILLDSSGYIKIIDFGFAKQTEPGRRCVTLCGTPEYLAPEVFLGRGYTSAVDFWALGILTWELVAGTAPWSTMRRDKWRQIVVYEAILAGLPAFPEHFSEELNKFLTALLQKKPEERLGARCAKKEEWLADTLWEQLWSTSLEPPSSIGAKIEQSFL